MENEKRQINYSSNQNKEKLQKAKKIKNDEFYTQREDIEKELKNYREHFKNKIVFLNCDDPTWSQFWFYFSENFNFLGLKKLISTHFTNGYEETAYALVLTEYKQEPIKINLKGNGDFRSEECIEFLKESDIVVTNPPFSLFREYVSQLIEYNKQFLIIGNLNAVGYKDMFSLIKHNKVWLGTSEPKNFRIIDGSFKKFGNINWYTNLKHYKRNEEIILVEKYYGNEEMYPKYDTYNAININKTNQIPKDYYGLMGVPLTFIQKYNPNQFEIIDIYRGESSSISLRINDKKTYVRILIQKIKKEES